MAKYYQMLCEDIRFQDGLKSCMNCGVCTAVCPAAEFYDYDPRRIVSQVQTGDDQVIEQLLKSDVIWYCGECLSCRPRCPRGNTPAYVIQALRSLSQRLGLFVESQKGRQQLAIKRSVGEAILDSGYCITPRMVAPQMHPEQGSVWQWIFDNHRDVYTLFTDSYMSSGAGLLRRVEESTLDEVRSIFELTGGGELFRQIESASERKAREMGYESADEAYVNDIFTKNSCL